MDQIVPPRETPGNRVATQESLAEAAKGLFGADFCAVQAVNPITERLYGDAVIVGAVPVDSPPELIQERLKSSADRAREHVGLHVEHFPRSSKKKKRDPVFKNFSIIAAVAFKTKRENRPMAVVILGFRRWRRIRKLEKALLKLFTDQWLPVLENVWLLGRYREVVKIGHEINQTLKEPRDLFQQLFESVSTVLDTKYFFMLAVYHEPNKTIDYHMAYQGKIEHSEGQPLKTEHNEGEPYPSGCAYAIDTKKSLVERSRSQNPKPEAKFVTLLDPDAPNPESLIFVPLVFRDEPLGVLSIQQLEPNAFDDEDLHIMTLLGNQVALAISDLRLFSYLEELNASGQQLTSQISADETLDSVVERIREATKADIVTLYPYVHRGDLSLECFVEPHLSGELRQPGNFRKAVRENDIAWLSIKSKEPLWAEDSRELFRMLTDGSVPRTGSFEKREQIASTAVLALRIEGESVGVLFINYRNPQLFKASQRNFIIGLGNFASIAINNNRRFRDLSRHRLEELELLRQIDLEISGSLNLKAVLQTILKSATEIVGGDEAAIFLYNPYTKQLDAEVSFGPSKDQYEQLSMAIDGKGLVPWVYKNAKAIRVGNVGSDSQWRDIYVAGLEETVSELAVPLKDDKEVVGVINFESAKECAFSEAHETFLVTLAGQAVLAIKNAQIYERAEEARRSLESLHEIAKEITVQRGDPERVIRRILSQARSLLGAELALFQQYEGGNPDKYYADASADEMTDFLEEPRQELGFELGIVKHVATNKKPYATVGIDAQKDSFYKGSPNIHSEVAVPLLTEEGNLIAVLDLESPRQFAFDVEDQRVLALFGELAVIAIKNARDYARAEEESIHAKDETKRFQLLWQAGWELAEIIDPSQLESAYNIVTAKVGEFSDGEVVIRRYDATTEELILVAVGRERSTKPMVSIPKSEGINGQVARELKTILVHDLDSIPAGIAQPVGDDPTIKTLVITPLLFERSYYGNLILSGEQPDSFSSADKNLLEGLAKQLAITIHRLEISKAKQDVEQHARDLTIMSDFGQSGMEIAHRLGNVLGSVALYVDSIKKIIHDEKVENPLIDDDLDRVERNVKALLSMANGLRQRIPELGREHVRTVVPVRDLLETAAWSVHEPEHIETKIDIENDLPDVSIVYGQIIDILRNLFINSVEAMPDGGKIMIRASYEREQAGSPSQHVLIEVSDNGPGIAIENQTKVFNLFFSTKESSGFGLWSARQYARANGGDLELRSAEGQGTTFTLTLPVAAKHRVEA